MTFIDTIPEDDAEGATADWYTADRERFGYLPNYTKVFGHRPAVYAEKFLGPETTRAVADGDAITVLEALGVQPDPAFQALEPDLRAALTVGRPIAEA